MRTVCFAPFVGRQVLLNGLVYVISDVDGVTDIVLKRIESGVTATFKRNDLARLAMEGTLKPLDGEEPPESRQLPTLSFDDLSPAGQEKVRRRLAYVNAVKDEFPVGPRSPRLRRAILATAERRGEAPPSPHTVYRWLTRFINSGHNVIALAQDAMTKRSRKSRLPREVPERLEQHLIKELGGNVGSTVWGVTDSVLEKVARELGYDGFYSKRGTVTLLAPAKTSHLKSKEHA